MTLDSDLIERSMALPPRERAELAEHLLTSLHQGGPDPSLDPVWLAELEARMDRYHRGGMIATDWDGVEQRLPAATDFSSSRPFGASEPQG
jgi:putative addiction module component (TIGR02574 family)